MMSLLSKIDEQNLAPGLYLIATPLGNLGDITLRAMSILQKCDMIFCEDTRVTEKLLRGLGLPKKKLSAYHDHNEKDAAQIMLKELRQEKIIALVSDAGMPLIADPGFAIVQKCHEENIRVVPVPGANAALAGLIAAGLPTNEFYFVGFPPPKQKARLQFLQSLKQSPATLLFYEAPHRLVATLDDMLAVFGDRHAAIARELTKLHEEIRHDPLSKLKQHYDAHPPKGEIVIVVSGQKEAAKDFTMAGFEKSLAALDPDLSTKDKAAILAIEFNIPKQDAYAHIIATKNK